jgi:hypothetical protein
MTRHHIAKALATAALLVLAQPAIAEREAGSDEASFLRSLEGRFSGNGTLQNADGSSRSLACQFKSGQQGSRLSLDGSCTTAAVFSTTIRIELRHDPKTGHYAGTFRESMGTVANLAGKRQGQRLTLAFNETAESVRPNPPATLTISRRQDGVALTLRGSQPGEGQNLDLSLRAD